MGEQRNLTEENVTDLIEHLKKMKEANPDLEYAFFKQTEQKHCKDCNQLWPPHANFCGFCGKKL